MQYRVGIGYDIHRLVEGRRLFLGGVEIPFVLGLLGHSDGDVLLHALCDALLGALGLGDIGEHFPDTDPQYDGISGIELLKQVAELVEKKKFKINNVDMVLVAEEPKLLPFKREIREKISTILRMKEEDISIKAKTNEGLDALGRKEAIAAYAVAAVVKGDD
ncbi:MAG: 2-C-methyl-D-erythritol 2,4-cyclodiphosphate synthase [Candidatus Omnitrophota bacterium]|nr:2-C-methyl-D-erythritol 2,4-cyclodiphosphate synthase [Candidatus Omnitrophota bacterium]